MYISRHYILAEMISCDSYDWNGQTYTESGTYYNHNISFLFNGVNDYIEVLEDENLQNLSENSYTISMWIKPNSLNSLGCDDNYSSILSLVRKDGEYNIMINDGKLYAEHFFNFGLYSFNRKYIYKFE